LLTIAATSITINGTLQIPKEVNVVGKMNAGKSEFAITQEKTANGVKFILQGRIDSNNSVALGRKLSTALEDGQVNIILDMCFVEFLCSTGIREILKAYKKAGEKGGKLGIETPSEFVKNVFGMVALDEMLIK
jgi:anti-anti-sigma factor